jgi:hypothetical protein
MNLKKFLQQQNWIAVLVLIILVSALSLPIFWQRIMTPTDNDYGSHIQFTQQILKKQLPPSHILAHPLVQLLVGGAFWLTRGRLGLWEGMIALMVLSNVVSALIVYFWLQAIPGKWKEVKRVFFALTIPFVAPILAMVPLDGRYYFGYIDQANYHNPTVQLLKPLALLVFILATRIFSQKSNSRWIKVAAVIMVFLSALAKQNYIISLLPALMLLMAIGWWQKWPMDWKLGLFGFFIPATLILAVQSYITFLIPNAEEGGFIFAPFVVESAFSHYLFWKFLLSIAFPLVVFFLTVKPLEKDHELQLAWFSFLAGIGQVYLFAESGDRMLHGNFRWSAQITLFVLFAVSVRFIAARLAAAGQVTLKQRLVAAIAYLPHLASGIVYYIYCLTSIHYG